MGAFPGQSWFPEGFCGNGVHWTRQSQFQQADLSETCPLPLTGTLNLGSKLSI